MTTLTFGPYHVELSNEDKLLFPETGVTKAELVDYYRRIAPFMLSFLRDRPITMERFPDGIDADGFYQRDVPDHFPAWIRRARLPSSEGTVEQVICSRTADLAYMANQGCITFHAWPSRSTQPDHPDVLVLDLDPPGNDFDMVRSAARSTRDLLVEIGLEPFAQTTGSRGIHIVAPIDGTVDFDHVRAFARRIAELLVARDPDRLTLEQYKDRRGGRLFIDTLRNSYAQSLVAPYAVRARPGAPVATPIRWNELDDVGPQSFTVHNVLDRLSTSGDPWKGLTRYQRSLKGPAHRLERMLAELRS